MELTQPAASWICANPQALIWRITYCTVSRSCSTRSRRPSSPYLTMAGSARTRGTSFVACWSLTRQSGSPPPRYACKVTRDVIRRLLVTDPAKRLTATQVRMQGHQGRDPSPGGHRPGQAAHRHTGTHAQSPGTSLGIGNALIYFYLLRPKKAVSAPQSGSFVVIIL